MINQIVIRKNKLYCPHFNTIVHKRWEYVDVSSRDLDVLQVVRRKETCKLLNNCLFD